MNQEFKFLSEENRFCDTRTARFICVIILIEYFTPSLSPIILLFLLCHALKVLWGFASTGIPLGRVSITLFDTGSRRTLKVEIGGSRHNNDWLNYLQTSARYMRRATVVYNLKPFKIDILLHAEPGSETVAIQNLSRTLESISASVNCPRAANLDLNVEIVGLDRAAICDAMKKKCITLGALEKLERLSWKGPFSRCLLQKRRPRQRVLKDLFLSGPSPPRPVSNIRLPHLKDLCLTDCVIEPSAVLDLLSCSPILVLMEVDRVGYPLEQSGYNQNSEQPNLPSTFKHLHIKHLTISSTSNLEYIFKHMQPQNLESLTLRLACSAIGYRVEEDIVNLEIPWSLLKKFELKAPMDLASMCSLNLFFKTEASPQGTRDHVLVEDWWMDSRRRLSFLHPRMTRSLVAP